MKRLEIKRTPLAETVLRSLEPELKLYRIKDGPNQLHFAVDPTGSKRWEVRFKTPDGKWSWMGIGGYPATSAKLARRHADAIQVLVSEGTDPREVRRAESEARKTTLQHPLSESAECWIKKKVANGYAPSTETQMRGYLDNDILPVLGSLPIREITPKHCADLQRDIEKNGTLDKTTKVRQALNQIFRYAIARGICIGTTKRLNRFSLRGKKKVQGQWQLYCLVHNIEKLANYGQLAA